MVKICIPCDKACIYRERDVVELFQGVAIDPPSSPDEGKRRLAHRHGEGLTWSAIVWAFIHAAGNTDWRRASDNADWKPRVMPILEEVTTTSSHRNTQVECTVIRLQILQGCSQPFVDPRLQGTSLADSDLKDIVCAAHVTDKHNATAIIEPGIKSFRDENLARRAPLWDKRGIGQRPVLVDEAKYAEIIFDLQALRNTTLMTASGSLMFAGAIAPKYFDKVVLIHWHQIQLRHAQWGAERHMVFTPILEDTVFVGQLQGNLDGLKHSSPRSQYEDCFVRELEARPFSINEVLKNTPYDDSGADYAISNWRKTICCKHIQPAGMAMCCKCMKAFVCIFHGLLFCPLLGVCNDNDSANAICKDVLKRATELLSRGASGASTACPSRGEATARLQVKTEPSTNEVTKSELKAALHYDGRLAHGRKQTTLLRRMYTLCMKNLFKWNQMYEKEGLEACKRFAQDGVEPAIRRKGSVDDWTGVLSFPLRPYNPMDEAEWQAWSTSTSVKRLNPLETSLIRVVYRNYQWWSVKDARFREFMYPQTVPNAPAGLYDELDQHLCREVFACDKFEFPGNRQDLADCLLHAEADRPKRGSVLQKTNGAVGCSKRHSVGEEAIVQVGLEPRDHTTTINTTEWSGGGVSNQCMSTGVSGASAACYQDTM